MTSNVDGQSSISSPDTPSSGVVQLVSDWDTDQVSYKRQTDRRTGQTQRQTGRLTYTDRQMDGWTGR